MPRESRINKRVEPEMNLIPFMNLMSALIPFLLVFAAFTQLAIIDINLPATNRQKQKQEKPKKKEKSLNLTVAITNEGLTIAAASAVLPKIPKKGGLYDYVKLAEILDKIKKSYTTIEEVTITPEPEIVYEVMIKVMDQCRENGFPNISLGAIL